MFSLDSSFWNFLMHSWETFWDIPISKQLLGHPYQEATFGTSLSVSKFWDIPIRKQLLGHPYQETTFGTSLSVSNFWDIPISK